MSRSQLSAASPVLLGVALAGVAFGAQGGTALGRTALVEVLVVLASGAVVAAGILRGRSGPMHGGVALAALAALALVTALSVTWSIAPELSYVEAGRTLAYLAVFAAAVAGARLAPSAAPAVIKGVLLGAVAVIGYSLASRVWPGALAENELSNRIQQPFGYWNAVGTTAALAVPATLWLGARRAGSIPGRALAYPALGLFLVAILLSQSRGALAAAVLGAVLWLTIVPLRLRSLPVILLPALCAAPVAAWALSKDAFAKSLQPLSVKESVAGEFGLLVLLMSLLLLVGGLAVNFALARQAPSVHLRKRIGVAAVALACLVPLALFTSVAFSDRGLGGTISDRVDELTSERTSAPGEGVERFAAASSTRSKYWREAGDIFADRPGLGTGAGTFGLARLRYRKDEGVSRHAHGFVAQTIADTGLVGLGVTLALLLAWLGAALRNTSLLPRLKRFPSTLARRDWNAERVALVGLGLVPVVFGLQSIIDWTWFVPGPAVAGLVAAGFVAGRGPLGDPVTEPYGATAAEPEAPFDDAEPVPRPSDTASSAAHTAVLPAQPERGGSGSGRVLAAGAVVVCALLFAWAIWQPEGSERSSNEALEHSEAGNHRDALAAARDAEDANPLSPRPLFVQAAVQTRAGQEGAAGITLERAVLRYPGDVQSWLRLAGFQLGTQDRPRAALSTLRGALYLDPLSKAGRDLYLQARARERVKQAQEDERARERAQRRQAAER